MKTATTKEETMQTETQTAKFTRKLRNLEGMLRRRDNNSLTGRNDESSTAHMKFSLRSLRDMVMESDEVAAALDADDKLAARYNKAERRVYNLPV